MRKTKEACDNLNKVLKGRAEIEENYGKQLVELSKNLIDQDEIISMRDSMETLRLEIEATGQSRIDLALDVKDQINSLLNEFSSNQEKIINNYKTVMERHLNLKNSHTQEVLKVNEKYQKKCEAALSISNKLNTCSEEEVGYYKNLLKQTMIEAKEIDKEYIMAVNRLHQIYRKWQQEWTRKCESFQKFEEERIRFLFDQMWNYANMFSTVCVADDEGCEKLRVQLEKCDSKKDIIYYIKEHKTGSVITEAPKYINYYSNIQYLEDALDLNIVSEKPQFTIPHSVRSDSIGKVPQQQYMQSQQHPQQHSQQYSQLHSQQHPQQLQQHSQQNSQQLQQHLQQQQLQSKQFPQSNRQSSFPNQYENGIGKVPMNNQLSMNQNYINGPISTNQAQQLQGQNHPNGLPVTVNQSQGGDFQRALEVGGENSEEKMRKASVSSLKKKFGKKRTSLYITNKTPGNSDDETEGEKKGKKLNTIANSNITNNINNVDNSNNNNLENENESKITKEEVNEDSNSIVSVVPQIPAVEEEEKRMSNIMNNSLLLEDINSESYIKTPIPNDGQQPSHALPPAPVMMDTSIIIPPSAILNNELNDDQNKNLFDKNMKSLDSNKEEVGSNKNLLDDDKENNNIENPQGVEISSNAENIMVLENNLNECSNENKKINIEGQSKPEIMNDQIIDNVLLTTKVNNTEEIRKNEIKEGINKEQLLIGEIKNVEESINEEQSLTGEIKNVKESINEELPLMAEVENVKEGINEKKPLMTKIKNVEEGMNEEQSLVADIKNTEDMEQKYNKDNGSLNSKVQNINENIKSTIFNELDIKSIPTFNELGFRDSFGNYSTTSTDDFESINIIEESSIEIPVNSSYNHYNYNRDSYNSQNYENNFVVIDDNDALSANTPVSSHINMSNLIDPENIEFDGNIPKLDANDNDETYEVMENYPIPHSKSPQLQLSFNDNDNTNTNNTNTNNTNTNN